MDDHVLSCALCEQPLLGSESIWLSVVDEWPASDRNVWNIKKRAYFHPYCYNNLPEYIPPPLTCAGCGVPFPGWPDVTFPLVVEWEGDDRPASTFVNYHYACVPNVDPEDIQEFLARLARATAG